MINHCLKFGSEQDAITAMPQYRDADGWLGGGPGWCLSTDLDDISVPTGRMVAINDARSALKQRPETTKSAGWHCNLLLDGDLPKELQAFEVFPVMPKQVFAGDHEQATK